MESLEFKRENGGGGCVLAVVEKEKAVQDVYELIGKLEIKSKNDFDRYKKKASSSQSSSSMMFGGGDMGGSSLVSEYGPYVFSFPVGGVAANQRKILRYFSDLPNSHHFEINYQD